MPGQVLGSLVAATFGLVYVLVNAGALPTAAAVPLMALGVAGFVAVLVALRRGRQAGGVAGGPPVFGRAYWVIVAVEVVALFGGLAVVNGVLGAPQAAVAWVSFVVGVHFFPLGVLFRQRFMHLLAAVITACGLVGFTLAFAGASAAPIAVVAGVVPGAVLLAAGWWGARRGAAQPA